MTSKSKSNAPSKKQITKLVRGIIAQDEEVKQNENSAALAAVFDGAGFLRFSLLGGIAVGAAGNARVGDQIMLKSIDIKVLMFNGLGATSNIYTHFRVVVFQYLGDSTLAAPLPMTYLLDGSALNAGGVGGAFSSINEDYKHQFKVLHDTIHCTVGSGGLAVTGSAGGDGIVKHLNVRINLSKCQKRIQYVSGATTGINQVYLLITTDQATIATNPTAGYECRVRYTDA